MTNADVIRQMNDDEIIELLCSDMCSICVNALDDNCGLTDTCKDGIAKWVKMEVSEDAGTD